MNIRQNIVLIVLACCVLLHIFTHNICAEMSSGRVIIIPPNEIYLSGFESLSELCHTCKNKNLQDKKLKKECNQVCKYVRSYRNFVKSNEFHQLYSDLGKLIFENMIEGITVFNSKCISSQKNFKYLLNTKGDNPIASCRSNNNIMSFYGTMRTNDNKMRSLLKKKKSDAFIWVEYPENFKDVIQSCSNSSTLKSKELDLQLVLFDGIKKQTKNIRLKFLKNYQTFSIKSIMELKIAVASLLFDNKFPEPETDEEHEEKKLPKNNEE